MGIGGPMSEKAETCFVIPQREAVAHFARSNARSTDAKMGVSDNGNAHTSIVTAACFRAGFLPLLGEHDERFPQQDLSFFEHLEKDCCRMSLDGQLFTILEPGSCGSACPRNSFSCTSCRRGLNGHS
jgi:hypothetical protein